MNFKVKYIIRDHDSDWMQSDEIYNESFFINIENSKDLVKFLKQKLETLDIEIPASIIEDISLSKMKEIKDFLYFKEEKDISEYVYRKFELFIYKE